MEDISLDYAAITIDTCIFENHGLSLEKGLLAQLEQFSSSIVKFVLSDVVYNELKKHLIDKNKSSRTTINQAMKAASNCMLIDSNVLDSIKGTFDACADDAGHSIRRLNAFQEKTSFELINSAEYADVSRLLTMYFSSIAPFELSGAKKSEFPDAFALLSIEKWAERNNIKVLAVSKDKGWIDFANTSNHITVVKGLAEALTHFQPHNFAESIIEDLRELLEEDDTHIIFNQIKNAIISSVENADDISIEATSRFYYEEEEIYAEYLEHGFIVDDSERVKINIVRVSSNVLVLQVQVEVLCEVNGYFSLSIRDSVDKDYLSMGSVKACTEESYVTSILLHCTGDFTSGLDNIVISEIEVLRTIGSAEFGDIEPNWGEDDPEWMGED